MRRNALDPQLWAALFDALRTAAHYCSVRALPQRGTGPKRPGGSSTASPASAGSLTM
ncbi:hypothetical protein [Nocardia carnea]|uniref:hypothetical protein n=1 Tax=Nocardia carnea TaxID=37328 RepID=UPI00245740B9|nr:hypothetical protein [Nocardia carnea]